MSFERTTSYLATCFRNFWILGASAVLLSPSVYAKPIETISVPSHKNSRSLFFDQSFDKKPLRPLYSPELLTRYLERSQDSTRAPVQIATKVTPLNITKVSDIIAPATIVPEFAMTPTASEKSAETEVIPEKTAKDVLIESIAANDTATLALQKPNSLESNSAALLVIDETSFLNGKFERVKGAVVHWLHPNAGLSTSVDKKGRARMPYPNAYSARYVVSAPGYLPATGYAVKGILSPVFLYKESRLAPILKSLDQSPRPNEHLLLGKFVSRRLETMPNMSFDEFFQDSRKTFYSLGAMGVFTKTTQESGPQGDFLLTQLQSSLQYMLPKQHTSGVEINEWPAQLLDLKGLGPVLSTTVLEHQESRLNTQFVDSFTGEMPNTNIYISIGGQRGVFEPDINGFVDLNDIALRPNVDLIEVFAHGYLKSWINTAGINETVPEVVPLFTQKQLQDVLRPVEVTATLNQTYIVGSLRSKEINKPVRLKVYDSFGKTIESAQIHYFDSRGMLSKDQKFLDLKDPRFVISHLPEGEHHIVALDEARGHGVSIQVVRAQAGTITHVQF